MSLLTLARDLRRRKARERQGLFVAEGLRTVEELLRSPLDVRGFLAAQSFGAAPRERALLDQVDRRDLAIERVSDAEFGTAAETESPQGILGIAPVPDVKLAQLAAPESLRLLILDAVQDPGNVGTILRTAAALGTTATISLPGTVDLWNAKVVRSAMGAHFHHSCLTSTWNELDLFRREHALAIWAADAGGTSIEQVEPPPRLGLVVGNEGAGLSPDSRARADQIVALPIGSAVESLNVAVATGILLYELRR